MNREKKILYKNLLSLEFTNDEILLLKKTLFQYGLTVHQFMGYVMQQMSINDPRIVEMLNEATGYKKQRILEGKEKHVDAETIYRMIADELHKNNANK
jgi:hypothetical protein